MRKDWHNTTPAVCAVFENLQGHNEQVSSFANNISNNGGGQSKRNGGQAGSHEQIVRRHQSWVPCVSEREPNGQTAIPHKACKHIKKPEIGFRRLTLVELSRNVMGPDGPHGQNGTIRSGHGSGDNTNETPGAQEGVGFVRQEFDKRLGIRNPFTTSRKSQNCGTSVGRELGVDRVWTIVKAD